MKKIKVVWLCQVVNTKIKQRLNYGYPWLEQLLNRILGRKTEISVEDYARWNTNAINEMRNNPAIELHVVSQFPYLRSKLHTYVEDGITFHFFRAEDFTFYTRFKYKKNYNYTSSYKKNTYLIHKIIKDINPDIIITAAYGQIIPSIILDYPKYGCINVHGSLLPKLRGGAPVHPERLRGHGSHCPYGFCR